MEEPDLGLLLCAQIVRMQQMPDDKPAMSGVVTVLILPAQNTNFRPQQNLVSFTRIFLNAGCVQQWLTATISLNMQYILRLHSCMATLPRWQCRNGII